VTICDIFVIIATRSVLQLKGNRGTGFQTVCAVCASTVSQFH